MSEKEASRELDALIAEKVMGWTDINHIGEHGWKGTDPEFGDREKIPFYSTDIEDAWDVVEKLAAQADPWMLTLKNWNYYGDRTWTAEFVSHPLGPPSVEIRADTAPLAICIAALRTVSGGGPSA